MIETEQGLQVRVRSDESAVPVLEDQQRPELAMHAIVEDLALGFLDQQIRAEIAPGIRFADSV